MDISAFGENRPGQVLKQGTGVAAFWAFVPHPLPPDIGFDRSLVRVLSDATQALGELGGLARNLANPYLFIGPFVSREAVASSRIEGTEADVEDLYAYEAGQRLLPGMEARAPESDVREVRNYVTALNYGLKRLETLPVSLRLIGEVHRRLLRRVRGDKRAPGEFRRSQNWIGPPGCTLSEATYVPPPVPEMKDALGAWEKYLHAEDDYPALVRLAFIHYQFEAIHPFIDGNGRIGRLLLSLLTVNWGLLPHPLLYLSSYFERHRDAYYDLLLAVTTHGAWPEWVAFFLRGVAEQSEDAVTRTRRLQDLQAEWRRRVTTARTSANLLNLLDHLFATPIVTIPRAQKVLGITYQAAKRHVDRLVGNGILKQISEGSYDKTYIAPEIMDIIRGDGE